MKRISLSIMLCAIILALLLAGCSTRSTSQPPTPTPTPTPMPSGRVDVGGHALYYKCSGQGSPTVILESGGGADSSYWADVFNGVKGTTRVCAYDRANLGQSDKVPGPRTFHDMTRDLQVLLENAHIGGPYVLVGWSMGGMLVRIYADQHPRDVVGVMLVDSGHPDMGDRLMTCLPPESADEPESIRSLRTLFTLQSKGSSINHPEGADPQVVNQQTRDVSTLGDLPLVAISQAPNIPGLGIFTSREPLPEKIEICIQQTWQDLQSELTGLSSNTTRLTARGGHMIPVEQPELIVQAIGELASKVRGQ